MEVLNIWFVAPIIKVKIFSSLPPENLFISNVIIDVVEDIDEGLCAIFMGY